MSARKRRLRPPWVLTGFLLAVFALVLVLSGYINAEVGNDAQGRDPVASTNVPRSVARGGPVVDYTGAKPVSKQPPPRTVALTFDDGPDPKWTPQVLAVLKSHHVHATFFVVGAMAARNPGLIRQIHEQGSEIGLHTFTHPDMATVSRWRFDRELAETRYVLAGAAGISTPLVRPPYSSTVSAIDNLAYRSLRTFGHQGYVGVYSSVDSEDWQRPGMNKIVRNATPPAGQGAVILMHDAGGDRAETVRALDRLIPRLQHQGYRFGTVSSVTGLAGNTTAPLPDRVVGKLLLATTAVAEGVVRGLQWILIGVGLLVVARLVLTVAIARRHARRRRHPDWSWGPPVTDPVSVIVPVYNERANIESTLRSILANDHPLEIIVVDDGSVDGTPDLVEELAPPRVRLVRQENGGKAAALNTGIAAANHELIMMMDGDTIFESDTVRRIVQPFADHRIGAVAGNVKVANRDTVLGRLQHIEYVVGFNIDRRVYDVLGTMSTIPGAAGAFRRTTLLDVDGLSHDTLAEDTDLTIAIVRAGWRVVYEDGAVAWTEAPSTVNQLWKQRFRWTYGTMQAMWKHRRAVVEDGASGRMGRLGLTHLALFQVLLPLSAPLIDVFLIYGLFFLNPTTTVLLWLGVLGLQMIAATLAFSWDKEDKGVLWVMPLQQIIYRQLMYVVLVQSVVTALAGTRVRWQKLRRLGGLDALLRAMPGKSAPPAGKPTPPASKPARPARAPERVVPDAVPWAPTVVTPALSLAPTVPDIPRVLTSVPCDDEEPTEPDVPVVTIFRSGTKSGTDTHDVPEPPSVPERPSAVQARPGDEWPLVLLVAVALAPVVGHTWFGSTWEPLVVPAIGLLFAVVGSWTLRAASEMPMVDVIGHGLRRVLAPFWVFALVLVPLMYVGRRAADGEHGLSIDGLLLWLFPVVDPPAVAPFTDPTSVVWVVRTGVWLLVSTPLLVRLYRRYRWFAVLAPVLPVGVCAWFGCTLDVRGTVAQALLGFGVFVGFWLLGFAHRDGALDRVPGAWLYAGAGAAVVGGAAWMVFVPDAGGASSALPFGPLLIGAAVTLLALRFAPWLVGAMRAPVARRVVTVLAMRWVVIYLWHPIAYQLAVMVAHELGTDATGAEVGLAIGFVALFVVAFGWVEDLAAHREIHILPKTDTAHGSTAGRTRTRPGLNRSSRRHGAPRREPPRGGRRESISRAGPRRRR